MNEDEEEAVEAVVEEDLEDEEAEDEVVSVVDEVAVAVTDIRVNRLRAETVASVSR